MRGLDGWVISDPATARLDDSDKELGQALRIQGQPTRRLRHVNSPRFDVTPGATYELTLIARIADGVAQTGALSIVFFGPRLSRDLLRATPPSGVPAYVDYKFAGTVPARATHAMVQFVYGQSEGLVDLSVSEVRYAETGTVEVTGWAVDRAVSEGAPGAGIDEVELYLDGPPGTGTLLGTAAHGEPRDDIAIDCGGDRFRNSGWRYVWDVSALPPGEHTLHAVMRSTSGLAGRSTTAITRRPAYVDDPIGGIDAPFVGASVADVITISGWAIDRNSTAGTGIDSVKLYLDGGATTGALLGEAVYGDPAPGVARHFGDVRFENSGWHLTLDTRTVSAGSHEIYVVLHSSSEGRTTTLSRALVVNDGRNVVLRAATSSSRSRSGSTSALAVDGSVDTGWNAGDFAPQWIEIDLHATMTIGRLRLMTTQTPPGITTHRVYGRARDRDMRLLHEFSGYTSDGEALEYVPATPWHDVRYIRVETTAGPSWVAWREIAAYVVGPTPTASLSGRVESAGTPIAGAHVELKSGDRVVQSAFTDDRGAYAFAGIPAGVYAVRANAPSAAFKRFAESPARSVDAAADLELEPIELPRR